MVGSAMARERLFALRETIARLEGRAVPDLSEAPLRNDKQTARHLGLGVDTLDEALGGGIPLQGLSEIRCRLLVDAGAASGFTAALAARLQMEEKARSGQPFAPVLWIGDTVATMEAGLPHAVGLIHLGLGWRGFFHAAPRRLDDALWLAETALESCAFCAVIFEVRGNPAHFGLTESRRLSLKAKAAGKPLLLLREGGEEEASSAACRFLVEPAPARPRLLAGGGQLEGSIGNPVFQLILEKSRSPAPLSLLLEWNPHDRRFAVIPDETLAHTGARLSASADRPHQPRQMGTVMAFDRAS